MLCAVNEQDTRTLRPKIVLALGAAMMIAGFATVFYCVLPNTWSALAPKDEVPVDGRVHELGLRADDHMLLVLPDGYTTACVLTRPSGEPIGTWPVPTTERAGARSAVGFDSGSGEVHVECSSRTPDQQPVVIRPGTHGDYNRMAFDILGYMAGGLLVGGVGFAIVLSIGSNWVHRRRGRRRALRTA